MPFLRTAVRRRGGGRCYPVRETGTGVEIMSRHSKHTYKVSQSLCGILSAPLCCVKDVSECIEVRPEPAGTSSFSYSVFQVGQVGVPPQAHDVDVHDAELGGEVIEVESLRERPHAQVHLRVRTKQLSEQSLKQLFAEDDDTKDLNVELLLIPFSPLTNATYTCHGVLHKLFPELHTSVLHAASFGQSHTCSKHTRVSVTLTRLL